MSGYRQLPTYTVTAGIGGLYDRLRARLFAYLDGGSGSLVMTITNTGAANAYVVANETETSSADAMPNDGTPRVFGPYAVSQGLPILYLENGADLEVTMKVRGF